MPAVYGHLMREIGHSSSKHGCSLEAINANEADHVHGGRAVQGSDNDSPVLSLAGVSSCPYGSMFWFSRKKFVGSYFRFNPARRSYWRAP